MDSKKIIEGLSSVDDSFIEESLGNVNLRAKQSAIRKRIWPRIGAAAAAVVVIVGAAIVLPRIFTPKPNEKADIASSHFFSAVYATEGDKDPEITKSKVYYLVTRESAEGTETPRIVVTDTLTGAEYIFNANDESGITQKMNEIKAVNRDLIYMYASRDTLAENGIYLYELHNPNIYVHFENAGDWIFDEQSKIPNLSKILEEKPLVVYDPAEARYSFYQTDEFETAKAKMNTVVKGADPDWLSGFLYQPIPGKAGRKVPDWVKHEGIDPVTGEWTWYTGAQWAMTWSVRHVSENGDVTIIDPLSGEYWDFTNVGNTVYHFLGEAADPGNSSEIYEIDSVDAEIVRVTDIVRQRLEEAEANGVEIK